MPCVDALFDVDDDGSLDGVLADDVDDDEVAVDEVSADEIEGCVDVVLLASTANAADGMKPTARTSATSAHAIECVRKLLPVMTPRFPHQSSSSIQMQSKPVTSAKP